MLNEAPGNASPTDAGTDAEHIRSATEPAIDTDLRDGLARILLSGDWTTATVERVDAQMEEAGRKAPAGMVSIDGAHVCGFDTAGAWLVARLADALRRSGSDVRLDGFDAGRLALVDAVGKTLERGSTGAGTPPDFMRARLEAIGRGVYAARKDFIMSMHILGATIRGAQLKPTRARRQSLAPIISQIDRMGVGAIPIITLMSIIIGAIIAQQGAFQLRYFGAEIFVVDLVGILVLREIGVLLTAIMIAGRSGSAITAEIGSMKMREEIDALTVIGLNPVGVLVFPRLVALVISLPLLAFIANIAALGGALLVSWAYSGISPETFIQRVRDAVDLSSVFSGLIKAPFMAVIIGLVASVEGMKVGGSAESLGRHVTASVVKAIFVVIVVDGIFAIFYAQIDF